MDDLRGKRRNEFAACYAKYDVGGILKSASYFRANFIREAAFLMLQIED